MRKLALILLLLPVTLPMTACSSSTQYENSSYLDSVRRRSDVRNNAFGRDLGKIQNFIDRHFWNYDVNDPYVNYPSDTTKLEHTARFLFSMVSTVPGVDEITTRTITPTAGR